MRRRPPDRNAFGQQSNSPSVWREVGLYSRPPDYDNLQQHAHTLETLEPLIISQCELWKCVVIKKKAVDGLFESFFRTFRGDRVA